MEKKPVIYTIGHSTHPLDYFLDLLKTYKINCLVDVRSVPASSYNPQYNQEALKNFLKKNGITYLHFPEEFGARHTEPALLNEGQVDFEKVRSSLAFKNGVERLWQGVEKGFTITLMCSEGEPLDCHRFSMVSLALDKDGFDVKHILKDKSLIANSELEAQLLKKYQKRLPIPDIFNPDISQADQLKVAYRLKNKEIGFEPNSTASYTENHD